MERLQERITLMEDERKGLEAKVAQLEESLELMQGEFESMEDYWQRKLEEERVFYEERARIAEQQRQAEEAERRRREEILAELKRKKLAKAREEARLRHLELCRRIEEEEA